MASGQKTQLESEPNLCTFIQRAGIRQGLILCLLLSMSTLQREGQPAVVQLQGTQQVESQPFSFSPLNMDSKMQRLSKVLDLPLRDLVYWGKALKKYSCNDA